MFLTQLWIIYSSVVAVLLTGNLFVQFLDVLSCLMICVLILLIMICLMISCSNIKRPLYWL